MTIAHFLKQSTRNEHRYLDSSTVLKHLVRPLHQQTYLSILRLLHGYYSPLELRLASNYSLVLQDLDWFDKRKKVAKLSADIAALSGDLARMDDACDLLPEVSSESQALGVLYVLEGATLGGQVIANILQKHPSTAEFPMAFFRGYQEETSRLWQQFCEVLDLYDQQNPTARSIIAETATETFVTLINWLERQENELHVETGRT